MISEEDKKLTAEAEHCNDCLGWHKYCKAECCKVIYINTDQVRLEKARKYLYIKPLKKPSYSMILYFKYRDVRYMRGLLRFPKDRIHMIGKQIVYLHPCSRLKGNLCLDHYNVKPKICRDLNLVNAVFLRTDARITPNCLYKYKLLGGHYGKKK